MIIGTLLLFTIILSPLGLLFGFVGFIMLIVGMVTSGKKTETVIVQPAPAQQQVVIHRGEQPSVISQPSQPSTPAVGAMKYCEYCGAQISADSVFCSRCGKMAGKGRALF